MSKTKCPHCENKTNDFVVLNQNAEYSGIEIAVDRYGCLRARSYPNGTENNFDSQDIVEIKYCPLCGKLFNK